MNLVGEKIFFRAIEMSDKQVLQEIINDGETENLLCGWSFPVSSMTQEEWIKAQQLPNEKILRCMIIDKKDLKAVGTIILSRIDYKNGNAECSIKLHRDARGKGIGTDSVKTLVNYAFNELRLKCIYVRINSSNIVSQKLFKKCGFKQEGTLRSRLFKQGKYFDIVIMSMIKD